VAVLVLLCQATAWVHASATPHVTCLEHGESVHLSVRAVTPAQPSGGDGLRAALPEAAAHAHEHCGLQSQRTTSSGDVDQVASDATFAPLPPSPSPRPRPTLAVLRLAPKTSPPRSPIA
jgi:hypothetical protein